MNKKTINNSKMKDLLAIKDINPAPPRAGDLISGKVIKVSRNSILLDLEALGTGIIYGRELRENKDIWKEIKIGQTISALVVEPENEDGYVELSLKEAHTKTSWKALQDKKDAETIVSVKIIEANRGGLIIKLHGVVGFLPVSQLSQENYPRVEGGDKTKILNHLNKFVNKEIKVKIISLDQKSEKLIVSEKALETEQIKENLKDYKQGDVVKGTVTSVADFGAFIKFGAGLEGLIHISELDWCMIDHPSRIVKENDKIEAKIVEIQDGHVSLSLKALKEDPWQKSIKGFKTGQVIKGQVIKFNPFGAFVEIDKGIYGLNHVSEFAKTGQSIKDALQIGQSYDFKILSFEPEAHKMSLALSK